MIEIPQNDYGAAEDAKIEAATRKVLDDLQRCGNSYLYRTGWPEWVAKCPKQDGPLPWDAERDVTDGNDDGEDKEERECA